MEPANKSPLSLKRRRKDETEIAFLPDADAIERGPLPKFVRLTLHVMLAAFVFFIVWASVSPVEKIVVAHGRLVNPLPNIVVQPLDTSIIQSIEVRVGQVVKKGQVLARLDPTFTAADEQQLRVRLDSLNTQAAGLRAELAGQPGAVTGSGSSADSLLQAQLSTERKANFEAQKNKMDQNIARLKAGLETNKHDQVILAQRVKSLREVEAMQEQLMAEQFGAKMHLLEARDRRLEVERDMDLQRNKAIEMASELASAQAERSAFDKSWRQKTMEDLLSATRDRDGINEQLAKADKRHKAINMVAPADGVVLEIGKLSVGSIVREAEPLFTLVPLGAQLEAEVQIDSLDIGYIKQGAPVHIKVDAFSFQQHGMLEGKVRTISQDAFKRETTDKNGGGLDAYYLSRIPYTGKLRKLPEGAQLLPGMTVSAEVVVGHRTVMSYLLYPLTRAMDESIREP
ncbi:HlyD family type I secretion periplasmic adaptor subunit [Duganella sp. BJB488]|uniref:HlyD family type I secretion periplasmic adaptor subunit n=1 Tax=unclassified Duganella TaxID=2636909 RepID=UPI000E3512EF|nr:MULTISPECIES: HlyD family type I secretion periplasmic adaptor subunit [unclassified Duganella]NVD71610.1 HlyD family type I secretion periplasmic adaptor subunit [Duganella sp. BJB1802]RFP09855.1 HlyD family type I secretion periplasmic adaptor subunit [Duganella sp. BJB489]RFP13487.1 HlyD family type I secretion periplasmic adaptor subunit [Duganella sp. BJB488]RFP29424.1 HlyD family type I secretion periplasmic adaptor subunit [Duganella sp. BJB480]